MGKQIRILALGLMCSGMGFCVACGSSAGEDEANGGNEPSALSSDEGLLFGSKSSPSEEQEPVLGRVYVSMLMPSFFPIESSYAFFGQMNPANGESTSGCTTTEMGECSLTRCSVGNETTETSASTPTYWNPGALSITSSDEYSAEGQWSSESGIVDFSHRGNGLAGGEELRIESEGGTLEAFSVDIDMPLAPHLISPGVEALGLNGAGGSNSEEAEFYVPREEDLILKWDSRNSAEKFYIMARDESGEGGSLGCTFNAAEGRGIISKDLLQALPSGTEIGMFSYNMKFVDVEGGQIQVATLFGPVTQDHKLVPSVFLD